MRPSVLQIGKYFPPVRGGMESHLADLCTGLGGRFDFTTVVANTDRHRRVEIQGSNKIIRCAQYCKLASTPICPMFIGVVKASSSDLVHLHWPNPLGALSIVGDRRPLVVTYHSDVVSQRVYAGIFEPILQRCLQRAQRIIVTSARYAQSSRHLRSHLDRCTVVPLGVELTGAGLAENMKLRRAKTECSKSELPIVISVGRLVSYKGFHHLIEAMAPLNAVLWLVGDGPLMGSLQRRVAQLGIQDKVVFYGNVARLEPLFERADVFVLPSVSRAEAFGIVQLEAMSRGLPVINTDLSSGVPWVSVHNETGITVPPENAEALQNAIRLLLSDAKLRLTLGSNAIERVGRLFLRETMIQATSKIYMDVLLGSGK
jgi:glycosyltransferase involved in cell wall biosynthesis